MSLSIDRFKQVPDSVMSIVLLPYLEPTELAHCQTTCKRLNALCAQDHLWKPFLPPSNIRWHIRPAGRIHLGLKGQYGSTIGVSQAKANAQENQHLYNARLGLIVSVPVIIVASAKILRAVDTFKAETANFLENRQILPPSFFADRTICLDKVETLFHHFLEVVSRQNKKQIKRFIYEGGFNPEERLTTILRIVRWRHAKELDACSQPTRPQDDPLIALGEHAKTNLITFSIAGTALCIATPLCVINYTYEKQQRESPTVKKANLIGGTTLILLGILGKMSGNEALGGFSLSSGVCFVIKGVVPQRVLNTVCGKVMGTAHAIAIQGCSILKSGCRKLKGFFW